MQLKVGEVRGYHHACSLIVAEGWCSVSTRASTIANPFKLVALASVAGCLQVDCTFRCFPCSLNFSLDAASAAGAPSVKVGNEGSRGGKLADTSATAKQRYYHQCYCIMAVPT